MINGSPRRLRVAMIGLGDIARKGYLPLMGADPDIDLVLVTRDPDTRRHLSAQWRTAASYPRIEDALDADVGLDAAFVHAATAVHPTLARTLIQAGVPTLVDKPLAFTAAESHEIVGLARDSGVSLMVGFNRRYAPAYSRLAAQPGLDTVVLTKNRLDSASDPREVIFDDFIHVVDTLRFMVAPEPDRVLVSARGTGRRLARIAITLQQGSRLGVGIMDRDSGATVEVLEGLAPGSATAISDLTHVTTREGGSIMSDPRDGWSSVAVQRGFTAMVGHFLGAVRSGRVLDAGDADATHQLCEDILTEVTTQLGG